MANYCEFDMIVIGDRADVYELAYMIKNHKIGRVYDSCVYTECDVDNSGYFYACISGDCAWSVNSAMRKRYTFPSLESESERLNLLIEVWSKEPGMEFQEHTIILKEK